jgi:hypothetical protein
MFRHTTILARTSRGLRPFRFVPLGVHRAIRSRSNKVTQILGDGGNPRLDAWAVVPAGFELPTTASGKGGISNSSSACRSFLPRKARQGEINRGTDGVRTGVSDNAGIVRTPVYATDASVQATGHKYLQPPFEKQPLVNILFTHAISPLRATTRLHHCASPASLLARDSVVCAANTLQQKTVLCRNPTGPAILAGLGFPPKRVPSP